MTDAFREDCRRLEAALKAQNYCKRPTRHVRVGAEPPLPTWQIIIMLAVVAFVAFWLAVGHS